MTCVWKKKLERLELFLWVAIPVAGMVATACGSSRGAEPDEVRDHLEGAIVPIVDDTALAFEYLNDSTVLDKVGASLDRSGMSGAWSSNDMAPEPDPEPDPEPVDPNEPTAGEQLAQFLRETIFTDDNYEGDGVYRIRGRDVCSQSDIAVGPGDPEPDPRPEVDPDCAQMIDDLQLRIEVLLVDDGFDATLLVGPRRVRPLKVESRDDALTVVVDFGASRAAVEHVASVTGAEVEMPDVLQGVVAATIRRDGERAATVSMSIRERVAFQMTTEDGPVSFEAAATDPLARISVDAIARHLEIETNAGPVLAELPWSLIDGESAIGGTLRLDLAGGSGTVVVDDASDVVTLTDLSLGDDTTRITLDDQTIFAIDVNAESGRAFDLTVTPTDQGMTMAFDPGLHVVTTIDGRPLAEPGDDIDPAADGDTYEILLDGDAPVLEAIDGDADLGGALRVASGRLTVSATTAETLIVEAGQCLLESDVVDGEHPALGAYEAGACP